MVKKKKFSKRLWDFYCALVRWIFFYEPIGITEKEYKKIWSQEIAKENIPVTYFSKRAICDGRAYARTKRRMEAIREFRKEHRKKERKRYQEEARLAFLDLF